MEEGKLSRRDFLKLSSAAAGALFIPDSIKKTPENITWPKLSLEDIPERISSLMEKVPNTSIDSHGYLTLLDEDRVSVGRIPVARTLWNLERNRESDRIRINQRTGIVLHWYADDEDYDRTVRGYLRGFDSIRKVTSPVAGSYETITSAHFLIGENPPTVGLTRFEDPVSILQTQVANGGIPTLASHLQSLDYPAHQQRRQYFIRSLYQLGYEGDFPRGVISLLQEFYDGPRVDANYRTLAIEIAGRHFDDEETLPSKQKIANVVSTVWALMKAYNIQAVDLMGHNEIELNKPDPGKEFMAEIRLLIGIKALLEDDPQMKNLVFGPFMLEANGDGKEATQRYFKFVRDYLVLSTFGIPEHVFDWEARTKYWEIYDKLFREGPPMPIANRFRMPVEGGEIRNGNAFLRPEYHEGVDLNTGAEGVINADLGTPILSVANGECIYSQEQPGIGLGKTIMLRHRLPEGAEVVSFYGHLDSLDISEGDKVMIGEQIGTMGNSGGQADSHLHFAIAYGATWDTDLSIRPYVPRNVERTWVSRRFINPLEFIEDRSQPPSKRASNQPQEEKVAGVE